MFRTLLNAFLGKKVARNLPHNHDQSESEAGVRALAQEVIGYYRTNHITAFRVDICNAVALAFKNAPRSSYYEGRGGGVLTANKTVLCNYLMLISGSEDSYCTALVEIEFVTTGESARFFFYTEDDGIARLVDEVYPYGDSLIPFHRLLLVAKAMNKPAFINCIAFTDISKSDTAQSTTQFPGNVVDMFPKR